MIYKSCEKFRIEINTKFRIEINTGHEINTRFVIFRGVSIRQQSESLITNLVTIFLLSHLYVYKSTSL